MPSLPDLSSHLPDLATLLAAVLGFVAAFFQTLWRFVCAPFAGLRRRIALAWHSRALYDALVRLDAHLASAGDDAAAIDDAIALLARLAPKAASASPEAAHHEVAVAPKPRRARRARRRTGPPLEASQAGQMTA